MDWDWFQVVGFKLNIINNTNPKSKICSPISATPGGLNQKHEKTTLMPTSDKKLFA